MANVSFNKLGCKINSEIKTIVFNDEAIEVTQYLPIQEKLRIMQNVIIQSMTEYNYANPVQVEVFTYLNILQQYTNIKFTEKQLADAAKLYDLVRSSGLLEAVCAAIPVDEIEEVKNGIEKSISSFYAYRNSVVGVLEMLKSDYADLNLDLNSVMDKIKDPEALQVLQELVPYLNNEQA